MGLKNPGRCKVPKVIKETQQSTIRCPGLSTSCKKDCLRSSTARKVKEVIDSKTVDVTGGPSSGQPGGQNEGHSNGGAITDDTSSNTEDQDKSDNDFAFLFSKLPPELQLIVYGFAGSYEGGRRIIEVVFGQDKIDEPSFRMTSPTCPYQACDIRDVMGSAAALRQFNKRFPNRLQYPGSRDIYFNAARDTIFLDAASIWALIEWESWPHLQTLYDPNARPLGFDLIRSLATPLVDNNIFGFGILRLGNAMHPPQIGGVVDPIQTLRGVPNAVQDLPALLQHLTTLFTKNPQTLAAQVAYNDARGFAPTVFGPPEPPV
ncbi:hypothetical protein L207DRAFT_585613 [Hyaloscypha variabilis F]|uniref:2EXR domain-containing protein n=1 Tax=Hyaloscypha variabilis (strain UAMH 11265 / GT02V1 / F) TaxID=1149755 RepID=A0A2J6RFG0_HYAVF|nr:hypothetical protein L207DRAFT_585613 [Hyaloscypha variabilis F]